MTQTNAALPDVLKHSPVNLASGDGALARLGELAEREGARHALLVTDPAIRAAGHVDRAIHRLHECFIDVTIFDGAEQNPTDRCVERGLEAVMAGAVAKAKPVNFVIGLGGGSAMDCAKGINLLHSNGGSIADYRGDPSADVLAKRKPLLPMILVPTTAGTGSEAQSFALISDSKTHAKMACGDRRPPTAGGLRPRWAILDPRLTWTMPPSVAAATGIDAITHAVETVGSKARTDLSRALSREAWNRLSSNIEEALRDIYDEAARFEMLLGAHLAGAAIENSMLGAAHACANPLTAHFDVVHGVAVGLMLPHVVRFNCANGANPYADLSASPTDLVDRLDEFLGMAGMPRTLRELDIPADALPELADQAAAQWTAGFNPRAVDAAALLDIYRAAYDSA
jgi:alcohol dehydrogenase